jgi:CDP-diacylglycerol--glycerol-3-phosphate 3-phosphatidyltransferase
MLTELARKYGRFILEPVARWLSVTGISPNMLTVFGFLMTFGVAYVLALGHLQLGAILVLLAALFDALDGTLARATGQTSRFGAFLDSTLDRFAEGVIFLGLFIHLATQNALTEMVLLYLAVLGSLMVSYTRARAEGLNVQLTEGLLTRLERFLVLVLGLLLNQVTIALWILAILANVTAVQRIWLVWKRLDSQGESSTSPEKV